MGEYRLEGAMMASSDSSGCTHETQNDLSLTQVGAMKWERFTMCLTRFVFLFNQTRGWWRWSLPDRLPQHHLKVQGIQIRSQIQHGRMAQHLILKTQRKDTQIIHRNNQGLKHSSSSSSFSSLSLHAIIRNSVWRLPAGCFLAIV